MLAMLGMVAMKHLGVEILMGIIVHASNVMMRQDGASPRRLSADVLHAVNDI
jgi:ribosomal protein L27